MWGVVYEGNRNASQNSAPNLEHIVLFFVNCKSSPCRRGVDDVERDVDEVVFAEDEHNLMMEAEIEHLQREAEIALNSRVDGDVLLPFFGDSSDMMLETQVHASLERDPAGDTRIEEAEVFSKTCTTPFSVMPRRVLKTLHEPMSNGMGTTQLEGANRTPCMIATMFNVPCHGAQEISCWACVDAGTL